MQGWIEWDVYDLCNMSTEESKGGSTAGDLSIHAPVCSGEEL